MVAYALRSDRHNSRVCVCLDIRVSLALNATTRAPASRVSTVAPVYVRMAATCVNALLVSFNLVVFNQSAHLFNFSISSFSIKIFKFSMDFLTFINLGKFFLN